MAQEMTHLSGDELHDLLHGRVGFSALGAPKRAINRRIVEPLIWEQPVQRNSQMPFSALSFEDCVFEKEVKIGEFKAAGQVSFSNCVFEEDVIWATLDNVSYSGKVIFEKSLELSMGGKHRLENMTVEGNFIVNGANKQLLVKKINEGIGLRENRISIRGNDFFVQIVDVSFDTIEVAGTAVGFINLNNVVMRSFSSMFAQPLELSLYKTKAGKVFINRLDGKGEATIADCEIASLVIAEGDWRKIDIEECALEHLEFRGIVEKDKYITITKSELYSLEFDGLYNNGVISFRSVSLAGNGRLLMKNSSLGKTDFILCQFEDANFIFQNSKLTEVFLAETNFPRSVKGDSGRVFAQAQLAFGQISTAYQKQGDTVRYLEYQAREIEAHYETLAWIDGKRWQFWRFSFTKLSLFLNKLSSDFGRNWGKGLAFSLGMGLVLYYFLIVSSDQFHIGWPSFDSKLVGPFFKFMNPLRFFETENLFKTSGDKPYLTLQPISYFVDFIARILLAYGYYQVIQAFRRYGRKS